MSTSRWLIMAAVGLVVCGCEEPDAIVPAGLPGTQYERKLPESESKDPPAAIGEQPLTTRGTPSKDQLLIVKAAPPTAKGETRTTESGVKYTTIKPGNGAEASTGLTVRVHYTGTLDDGTKFDSSRDRNEPFAFVLGEQRVIRGWEEGVNGMKVGEERKLTIPPAAGYGAESKEKIPPNSTLHFDIELIEVH